jgi:hypothetical protein
MLSIVCLPRQAMGQEQVTAPAQETNDPRVQPALPPEGPQAATNPEAVPDVAPPDTGTAGVRMFGVLPNYTTVEGATQYQPVSAIQKFHMAEQNSFDPYVFPFVGVVALVGAGQKGLGFGRRYAMALADNSIGNYLTTAVLPSALHQDPRYFERGTGSVLSRIGYAASRSLVTHGASGASQFNVSEIGGNGIAAAVSNLYYPAADRVLTSFLTRWGTQVMWDTLSNELKEFWPDVRRRFSRP